jgi:hypothetical protein
MVTVSVQLLPLQANQETHPLSTIAHSSRYELFTPFKYILFSVLHCTVHPINDSRLYPMR